MNDHPTATRLHTLHSLAGTYLRALSKLATKCWCYLVLQHLLPCLVLSWIINDKKTPKYYLHVDTDLSGDLLASTMHRRRCLWWQNMTWRSSLVIAYAADPRRNWLKFARYYSYIENFIGQPTRHIVRLFVNRIRLLLLIFVFQYDV